MPLPIQKRHHGFFVASAPLIACLILSVTVIPEGFRRPHLDSWHSLFDPGDTLRNVFLYVPLGLALCRFSLLRVGVWGALLSAVAETAQLFIAGRSPQIVDVFANAAGMVAGAFTGRWLGAVTGWSCDRFRLSRARACGAALLVILLGTLWISMASGYTDFSNWDPLCRLAAADEPSRHMPWADRDRPWEGEISEVAVFAAVLDPGLIARLSAEGSGSIAANRGRFPQAPIFERTSPLDLTHLRGRPLLNENEAALFFDALIDAGRFSVLVRCQPARLDQFGPARILTYSRNPWLRNFTLGQEGRQVVFRVRTPLTGPNAIDPDLYTPAVLTEGEDVLLAATYDGQLARVFVRGQLASQLNLAREGLLWHFVPDSLLPSAFIVFGALPAAIVLGLAQPRSPARRLGLSGVGGCAGAILLLLAGGAEALPFIGPYVAVLSLVGGLSLAWPPRFASNTPKSNTAGRGWRSSLNSSHKSSRCVG